LVNCLRDIPMTQFSIPWILSLNHLSHFWGQVHFVHDVEDIRRRTVPNDGRLVGVTEPVKNEYGIRAKWEVWPRLDSPAYVQWLKNQFPDYRVVSETASTLILAKQVEADSYSLEVSFKASPSGAVAEVTFVAGAD